MTHMPAPSIIDHYASNHTISTLLTAASPDSPTMATLVPPTITTEKLVRIFSVGRVGYAKDTLRNSIVPFSDDGAGFWPSSLATSMTGTRSMMAYSLNAALRADA